MPYLVDLAITNAGSRGKATADGGAEGRRPGDASGDRGRREGWPCAGKGLDAAAGKCWSAGGQFGRRQQADTARGPIVSPIGHWECWKSKEGAIADLLNILPDIEERLLMRVEVGAWVGLREEIETGRLGKLGRDDGELALLLCTGNREGAPLFTCSREEPETGWHVIFPLSASFPLPPLPSVTRTDVNPKKSIQASEPLPRKTWDEVLKYMAHCHLLYVKNYLCSKPAAVVVYLLSAPVVTYRADPRMLGHLHLGRTRAWRRNLHSGRELFICLAAVYHMQPLPFTTLIIHFLFQIR